MAPCHHFAEQALHILRYLAKKWGIEINIPPPSKMLSTRDAEQLVRPHTSSMNFFVPNVIEDDFLCAWGPRSSQPSFRDEILPGIDSLVSPEPYSSATSPLPPPPPFRRSSSNLPIDTDTPVAHGTGGHGGARRDSQEPRLESQLGAGPTAFTAKSIENPLFWPFPMQGRPMLPSGSELEAAGFAPL